MSQKTYEILIIDDAKTMRLIVKAVLSDMNSNFDFAEDGLEAFELIKQKQYDVIISDIHMPKMTGLELCLKTRQELKFKNLPILIMTTDNSYDTVEKVFKAGATDFISKPINELELTSRVDRILEQRRVEKELYIAKSEANTANQRKSEYLANVNHELKTPLNGIYGYAQVLQSMESDQEKLTMLNMVVKASEQMTSMINQLLELEQIETGHIKLKKQTIEINDLLQKCININQLAIQGRELIVSLDVDANLTIHSDMGLLYSVLSNLLSNAIKYNKTGGTITISSRSANTALWIDIKDTGIGMNKEQLAKVYDPFTRFDEGDAKTDGHGLGMAITKSTVSALGMKMAIESESKIGTSVSLQLA